MFNLAVNSDSNSNMETWNTAAIWVRTRGWVWHTHACPRTWPLLAAAAAPTQTDGPARLTVATVLSWREQNHPPCPPTGRAGPHHVSTPKYVTETKARSKGTAGCSNSGPHRTLNCCRPWKGKNSWKTFRANHGNWHLGGKHIVSMFSLQVMPAQTLWSKCPHSQGNTEECWESVTTCAT